MLEVHRLEKGEDAEYKERVAWVAPHRDMPVDGHGRTLRKAV